MPSDDEEQASGVHAAQHDARRLALGALFEADFGQNTAAQILTRRIDDEGVSPEAAALASNIVDAAVENRVEIDAQIEAVAPRYPVVQLARIDRALLRSAMAELLAPRRRRPGWPSPSGSKLPARTVANRPVACSTVCSGESSGRRQTAGLMCRPPAAAVAARAAKDRRTGGSTG